ncbi:hypothetical protein [Stappia sp. P2PMeth1]|uniref:hypothetical protein n=1 Tax=Stappia sp. P2PMeth1 TaxID=2003586 RepID=UPI0016469A48|nr:hypothetical protein [Stappia sp. P2PMeth1]
MTTPRPLPDPDTPPLPLPFPPQPVREPDPERLPDEEPLPNPDEQDNPPQQARRAVRPVSPWSVCPGGWDTVGSGDADPPRPGIGIEARTATRNEKATVTGMQDTDDPRKERRRARRGDYRSLLRQVESEPVPERLLDLARKLESALAEQRRRQHGDGGPADR